MTAFARESIATDSGIITVEIRSVNHRYLDCSFRLPEALRPFEGALRELTTAKLSRGKLECQLRIQKNQDSQQASLQINFEQLDNLLVAVDEITSRLKQPAPLSPLDILQYPGVSDSPQASDEQLGKDTQAVFARAMDSLLQYRGREGAKMSTLISERLLLVEQEVARTRSVLPQLMQQQRDRVVSRITELAIEVDFDRLEQELVHMLQKADVDEELDRLDVHIAEVRRALSKGGPCGRRLDFLMQELNREANTLSSKSQASSTTQSAVELKVLIEQMREQIQNIE